MSSRTVLLYAQSGAGKTSLVQAGLIPLMESEQFDVLPAARVQGVLPRDLSDLAGNVYTYFTLLSWEPNRDTASIGPGETLASCLGRRDHTTVRGEATPRVLIFDQFEELFTSFPERASEREEFLAQVAEALRDDYLLRALFVIREDYLADVLAVADILPDGLRSSLRLSRLGPEDALDCITGPLGVVEARFAEGVAEALVDELLLVRVELSTGDFGEIRGEFVEPVQLQVVCDKLWRSLPRGTVEITAADVQRFGRVTDALSKFYDGVVAETARLTGVTESRLRDWFGQRMITGSGTRNMVHRGRTSTGGIPNPVVDVLDRLHIVTGEVRGGARWYELTHDRFIGPIQESNARQEPMPRLTMTVGVSLVTALIALLAGWKLSSREPLMLETFAATIMAASLTVMSIGLVRVYLRHRERLQVLRSRDKEPSKRADRLANSGRVTGWVTLAIVGPLFVFVAANVMGTRPEDNQPVYLKNISIFYDSPADIPASIDGYYRNVIRPLHGDGRLSVDCGGSVASLVLLRRPNRPLFSVEGLGSPIVGRVEYQDGRLHTEPLSPQDASWLSGHLRSFQDKWCKERARADRNFALSDLGLGVFAFYFLARAVRRWFRTWRNRRAIKHLLANQRATGSSSTGGEDALADQTV